MITAFIVASHDAKALTRTLNALVGATVEGLIREVVVIAETGNGIALNLAEHAGCDVIAGAGFIAAVRAAKGDWLLVLEAGALPELGWAETVGDYIQYGVNAARFKRSPLSPRGFLKRVFQFEPTLALGLIVEKRAAITHSEFGISTPENLAKVSQPRPLSAALRPASSAHQGEG